MGITLLSSVYCLLTGVPLLPEQELQAAAAALFARLAAPRQDHAAVAAMALGHAGLRVPLPLPLGSPETGVLNLPYAAHAHNKPSSNDPCALANTWDALLGR